MNGNDVWQFRWRDTNDERHRVQRSRIIGTVDEYPTEKPAQRAVDAIRLEVNAELPTAGPITVETLIDRYLNDAVEMERLAFSTKASYTTYLRNSVQQKWGAHVGASANGCGRTVAS